MGHLAGQSLDLGWSDGFPAKLHDSRNSAHLKSSSSLVREAAQGAFRQGALSMKTGIEKPEAAAPRHGKTAEISAESPQSGHRERA
jgi:hypothetical protein